ncbi:hypothetical protein HBH46_128350 [Parastagonospora nodorum]|nr:hypothetical protein HBH46_128350 [Parastagonospora nodorum]
MTATDPACDGTFDILDNLPDKIRPKYVDKLTRDQMAQVILSVWRERDAANANAGKQLTSKARRTSATLATSKPRVPIARSEAAGGAIKTFAEEPKHARGEKRSLSAVASSDLAQKAAKKSDTDRIDLIGSFGLLQLGTKTYGDIGESMGAESDDSETFGSKSEDDEEQALHSIPSKTPESQNKGLPIHLYVHSPDGGVECKRMQDLPLAVYSELRARLDLVTSGNKSRLEAYLKLLRSPAKYVQRPFCVCDQILKNLRTGVRGRATTPQTFLMGGELGRSADDKCIKENTPCLHVDFVCDEQIDGYFLCIVPLPGKLRENIDWTDLHFWVEK